MAGDLWSFALDKAELLSGRIRELVTSGQGVVRARFGVDLGLKPELYPTWVILSTAAVGVLLLLLLLEASWAAVCGGGGGGGGGQPVRKKRALQVNQAGDETTKAGFNNNNNDKSAKPEEQKKRNKKKAGDKKTQSNGQPPVVAQEEVKATVAASETATEIKAEKIRPKFRGTETVAVEQVHEVQAPVQTKKNKKKPKTEAKPVQPLSTSDGKEPDDGAWETKVSNREKRQQRRKEKGSEDSGSPGGVEAYKPHVDPPAASVTGKKKRGNNENQQSRPSTKGDPASGKGKAEPLSSSSPARKVEPTVNGGGWSDVSLKASGPSGSVEGTKWSSVSASARYRPQTDPQPWTQESQAWSSVDGKMKKMAFSVLQPNSTDALSTSAKMQWVNQPSVDDQWSGFKGVAADSTSDWNAPAEHWGNYEEPPVPVAAAAAATPQQDQPKVSEDEKEIDDPSEGAAKSKKKRKKKKKTEEEPASDTLTPSAASVHSAVTKAPEHPALPLQNTSISSSQKKSEPTVEPQKPSQKKKVRRET
ncbi:metadherin a isoform X2 [Fundulus heteroclitus]|uniref:metadherin a isoform X2 n=1 Tax=Fundulus heteroclitus TaxID=8078 RepID=UPI00165CB319|nr:metadherin a isoform X2 [Fundulus heteroclitus]